MAVGAVETGEAEGKDYLPVLAKQNAPVAGGKSNGGDKCLSFGWVRGQTFETPLPIPCR